MARFQYNLKSTYGKYIRNWGKKPRPCDYCGKPIPKGATYYETALTQGSQTFIDLSKMPYDTYMALDDHYFCMVKCLKAQCSKHGDKELKEYIDMANKAIKEMPQDEYDYLDENDFFKI